MVPTRARRARLALAGLLLALTTAACGSSEPTREPGAEQPAPSDAPSAGTDAAFPTTIDHAYGSTTVEAEPERLVVVGYKEADYFLALDAVPIAIRDWYGDQPNATWPWAQDHLRGQDPEVLPRAELDYERILELEPDLIVGLTSGMSQDEYDTLAAIAPTIAQPADTTYDSTWQDLTRTAGKILGRTQQAEGLVTDLEDRFDAIRTDHPELQGASTVLGSAYDGDFYLYGPESAASRVLLSLGLTISDEITELTDNEDTYFVVSPERLDLFDVDVAVWSEGVDEPGIQSLLASPLYQNLRVSTEDRAVFLGDLNGAMVFSTILSLPTVIDEVVPALAAAVDGDPATTSALGAP